VFKNPLFNRIGAAVVAAVVLAGCGGASRSQNVVPTASARRPDYCNVYFSTKRAVKTVRSTQSSATCNDPIADGSDIFSDVESFNQIVDATSADNPCDAGIPRCGNPDIALDNNVIANPGGPATRGDNCTPVNGYAIGYSLGLGTGGNTLTAPGQPIPSTNNSATIVNQSQVFLQNFVSRQPIGWLLYTQGDGVWFVPNLSVGFSAGVLTGSYAVPGAYKISDNAASSRKFINAIRGVFNLVANEDGVALNAGLAAALQGSGATTNNVPCNTTQLT